MLKRFFKALLDSLIMLMAISIVFWLLNKLEVDARGIENVMNESQYDSWAFVNFYDLEVFNIAVSLLLIILVIYVLFKVFVIKSNKKSINKNT
ncbi:hypothetical protein [Mammaliicoccus vitulinus]|uniref:hypothetical protein n=1 Tax=Mammaliicoccus vitulinus TaxID=71237 RepID=UPI000E6A5D78|nr:hypothetical protein [Mammaliicoccus vitulinus]RIN22698.1 hypothetical protein BU070_08435 [Mammaliicoccus vitulinus]